MNRTKATAQSSRPWRRVHRTKASTPGLGVLGGTLRRSPMAVLHHRRVGHDATGRLGALATPSDDLPDPDRGGDRIDASKDDVDDPVVIEVDGGAAHPHIEENEQGASEPPV